MRRAGWLAVLLSPWLCSCSASGLPSTSGSPPSGADLASTGGAAPDLRLPLPDLAIASIDLAPPFCAGTPVAGTCAAAFFAPATGCFHPAGACTYSLAGGMVRAICWASGARAIITAVGPAIDVRWSQGATPCLSLHASVAGYAFARDGQTLQISGNDLICDDGTRLVGLVQKLGACPQIASLALTPPTPPPGCMLGPCG